MRFIKLAIFLHFFALFAAVLSPMLPVYAWLLYLGLGWYKALWINWGLSLLIAGVSYTAIRPLFNLFDRWDRWIGYWASPILNVIFKTVNWRFGVSRKVSVSAVLGSNLGFCPVSRLWDGIWSIADTGVDGGWNKLRLSWIIDGYPDGIRSHCQKAFESENRKGLYDD